MEIDQTTYDNLSNNRGGLNTALWKVISIFWQISGLDSIKNIQFKLELTTPSGSDATPNLLKVIVY
jgi:hypothetical protein